MYFLDQWFWLVLCAVLAAVRLSPLAARRWLLLAWSCGVLGWISPWTLMGTAGAALVTWGLCWWIASATPDTLGSRLRAWTSTALIAGGVIALRLFGDFFGGLSVSAEPSLDQAIQLLGVAYLALKLHHCVAMTRYDPSQRPGAVTLLGYALYLPVLSGGPIMRLREWVAVEAQPPAETLGVALEPGVRRIIWGLSKKVLAAPVLIWMAARLEAQGSPWSPAVLLVSMLLIYVDFSGYSDIAIGTGRLLGHRIRENFASPFMATSLSHFWRGWHITMGDWLREHIFVPLGGMRASRARLAVLAMVTMLFCGLWHAFEWRFVLWGLFHGLLLAGEALLGIRALPPHAPGWKLWLRRAVVVMIMAASAGFFVRGWWA